METAFKGNICMQMSQPFPARDPPVDFTLSNARRFYSSKSELLGSKGLKNYFL